MRKIEPILPLAIYLITEFIFDTAFNAIVKYGIWVAILGWILFQAIKFIARKNLIKGVKNMLEKILHATKRIKFGIPIGILSGITGILSLLGVIEGVSIEAITGLIVVAMTSFGVASSVQAKVVDAVDKIAKKMNNEIISENGVKIHELETANERLKSEIALLNVQINAANDIPTLAKSAEVWIKERDDKLAAIAINDSLILGYNEMSQKLEEAV